MAEQGSTPGEFAARVVWVVVGVLVIGLGSGLLTAIDVGVDPYTAANIGISTLLGWDLGSYQLLSNLVLFIPMLIWGRKYIGVGSVANMVFTGYAIQFFAGVLTPLVPDEAAPVLKMILFVMGICVFALGASLYMTAALGTAPYDALAPMIVDATGAKYRVVRTAQDGLGAARADGGSTGLDGARHRADRGWRTGCLGGNPRRELTLTGY